MGKFKGKKTDPIDFFRGYHIPGTRYQYTKQIPGMWDGSPFAGFLSLREVWRHTEVGYVRNGTLEGQR